jgi:AcrR family transcriptional regulator
VLYVITIRNPIQRFISAFYFKWNPLYNQKLPWQSIAPVAQGAVPPSDIKRASFYHRYKSVGAFAEALYDERGRYNDGVIARFNATFFADAHISAGISFYLSHFLPTVPAEAAREHNNFAVLTQENLSHDALAALNISVSEKIFVQNGPANRTLSARALANLRRFLAPDYACVERLNELGLLSQSQYAVLADRSGAGYSGTSN